MHPTLINGSFNWEFNSLYWIFSDGWEFELHASQVDKSKNQIASKFLQVAFITNIETMLECYISLYDMRNSSLQEVFLRPSSALEDQTDSINDNKVKHVM